MSRATSYTLTDHMELAGPEEDHQIDEARRWLEDIRRREKSQPGNPEKEGEDEHVEEKTCGR